MIVLGEKHGDTNVIHLIAGKETDFQVNLTGQVVIDMTDNITFNSGDKVMIVFNRCESEELLKMQIQTMQEIHHLNQREQEEEYTANGNSGVPPKITTKNGIFIKELKCPKCESPGCYIKNGEVSLCKTCIKIDEGLKTKEIPGHPSQAKKDEIVEEVTKDDDFNRFLKNMYEEGTDDGDVQEV